MKKLIPIILLLVLSVQGQSLLKKKTSIGALPQAVAGGGPDVWYDTETAANGDSEDFGTSTRLNWTPVTVAQAGTATKIRVYVKTFFSADNIKAALYSNAGALLASGTGVSAASDAYVEITLGSPTAVTATTYKIAWMNESGTSTAYYKAGVGSFSFNAGSTYAGQPEATLPADSGPIARAYVVGVYVD